MHLVKWIIYGCDMFICMVSFINYKYYILQIVQGGKVLQIDKLVPIRQKTFMVCQLQ